MHQSISVPTVITYVVRLEAIAALTHVVSAANIDTLLAAFTHAVRLLIMLNLPTTVTHVVGWLEMQFSQMLFRCKRRSSLAASTHGVRLESHAPLCIGHHRCC